MLTKKQRLIGKEVVFLTKKRQYIGHGLFGFFYTLQYLNIAHHQLSSHITLKLSKKSVTRHIWKRAIIQSIQDNNRVTQPIWGKYYKIFIVLSKERIAESTQKIANLSKKDTITYIQEEFVKSRKYFVTKVTTKSIKSF